MSSNIQPISVAYVMGGWGDQPTQWFAEAASQSFKIGAPLTFSSGYVEVIASVTSPAICGIALTKASGTQATAYLPNIQVTVPLQGVVFKVCVDSTTTSGDPALGTGYPSQFNIGSNYQLLLDSTSGNYYMGSGTSNAVWQLLGYDPNLEATINAQVYARILTSQTIYS